MLVLKRTLWLQSVASVIQEALSSFVAMLPFLFIGAVVMLAAGEEVRNATAVTPPEPSSVAEEDVLDKASLGPGPTIAQCRSSCKQRCSSIWRYSSSVTDYRSPGRFGCFCGSSKRYPGKSCIKTYDCPSGQVCDSLHDMCVHLYNKKDAGEYSRCNQAKSGLPEEVRNATAVTPPEPSSVAEEEGLDKAALGSFPTWVQCARSCKKRCVDVWNYDVSVIQYQSPGRSSCWCATRARYSSKSCLKSSECQRGQVCDHKYGRCSTLTNKKDAGSVYSCGQAKSGQPENATDIFFP